MPATPAEAPFPLQNLIRFVQALPGSSRNGVVLRAVPATEPSANANGMPTMFGHFSVFNVWTEINSWEGNFLERVAPGAYKKTFREQRDQMRPLFQHGMDYLCGDKPLGPIDDLREDDIGAYYEVPLLDATYVRDLIPGLEEGLYGASFRFSVVREDINQDPGVSDYNPHGIPERTIREARVMEFGPVTFPAYPGATASVRSLRADAADDKAALEFVASRFGGPDKLRGLLNETRMDSEDVGTLAQMLACASQYIAEQDEETPAEVAAAAAMQAIQADLIKLMNVEAVEDEPDEPDEPDDERAQTKDPAPSTADAAPTRTSGQERREDAPADAGRAAHDYLSPKEKKPSWHI